MKNKTLIAMCGLVGSGKSFVAKELGKLLDCPVVSKDVIRLNLRKSGKEYSQATDIMFEELKNAVKTNDFVILDSDNIDEKDRALVDSKVKEENAKILRVYVKCPIDISIGRILSSDPGEFFNEASTDWKGDPSLKGKIVKVKEMWRRTPLHYEWVYEPTSHHWKLKDHQFADYIVDTGSDSVLSQIQEVAASIKSI